tara:strand:+ start:2223 stop:2477 length:255 start_codon:yes stop_codon:yes gene_type:complete
VPNPLSNNSPLSLLLSSAPTHSAAANEKPESIDADAETHSMVLSLALMKDGRHGVSPVLPSREEAEEEAETNVGADDVDAGESR